MQRRGLVLAGGAGSRLFPMTTAVSKQMLPLYDKPMIYYSLSTLLLSDVRHILVISTSRDLPMFRDLLGDGSSFGARLEFAEQDRPNGLAEAFLIGEKFLDGADSALVLGDNVFYGEGFSDHLINADRRKAGATVFSYPVQNPRDFGVVTLDGEGHAVDLDEKPAKPKSNLAVVGLYYHDARAPQFARGLKPSPRGELEITDLNRRYLKARNLHVELMGRGYAWLDTGTIDSLLEASEFVGTLERRQGLKIGCPEEVALRSGFVTSHELNPWLAQLGNSPYAAYVRKIAGTV